MATSATSILIDALFCALLLVFVQADQALLDERRARGETNLRKVRAFPFVVLGAVLGLLVLPVYFCASRSRRTGRFPASVARHLQ